MVAPSFADALFVPESYEPNYAYPLIIWLTDSATRQYELCRIMPQISTRNYFGVSLPAWESAAEEVLSAYAQAGRQPSAHLTRWCAAAREEPSE